MPIILLLLAGGLAANVLFGPLGLGIIQWRAAHVRAEDFVIAGPALLELEKERAR